MVAVVITASKHSLSSGCALGLGQFTAVITMAPCVNYYLHDQMLCSCEFKLIEMHFSEHLSGNIVTYNLGWLAIDFWIFVSVTCFYVENARVQRENRLCNAFSPSNFQGVILDSYSLQFSGGYSRFLQHLLSESIMVLLKAGTNHTLFATDCKPECPSAVRSCQTPRSPGEAVQGDEKCFRRFHTTFTAATTTNALP